MVARLDSPRRWKPSMEGNERLRAGFPLNGARGQHALRDDIRTRLPPLQQPARGSASTTRLPARGGRGPRMMSSSKSAADLGARRRAAAEATAAMRDHQPPPELPPCLLYTSPSPRDRTRSRMPSSA